MNDYVLYFGPGGFLVIVLFYLFSCIKILSEYERGVIFRLGSCVAERQRSGADLYFFSDRPTCADCHCGSRPSTCLHRMWSRATTSR